MSAKFTPGPWAYKHDRVMDSEGAGVAHPQWQGRDDEEIGANGALIAAAPDLYREMERAVRYFTDADSNREAWGEMVHEWQQTLAKARGEA